VTAATFDERSETWSVETETGDHATSRFVVAATGCLSAPLEPDIPGLHSFAGDTLYTNRFPKEGYDFSGKRVAVVGTGSSGVQSIPVIAADAGHLYVLQRSAAYTLPSNTRPLEPGELDALKSEYPEIRRQQREAFAGTVRFGAFAAFANTANRNILDATEEERLQALDERGWLGPFGWSDVMVDIDANRVATRLYGEMIRRSVHDPAVAETLVPQYPFGCKRPVIDVGYFETFNRDNVTLVDLKKEPIVEITPEGITTRNRALELDVIVLATGFDAMTGALTRIDIRGRDGVLLRDTWAEGPRTYLGLQVAGFPNLFTVTGPGSPSVLTNMVTSIEQHVDWITDCLAYLRDHGLHVIEADADAQDAWVEHGAAIVAGRISTHPSCSSWYLGANIPGKTRVYMPYGGGLPAYRERCANVAAAGYEGFALS
jgi:cyclohexanone monooxygenase